MPYDSKGMVEVATAKRLELAEALWQASEQGCWPVLLDTSPCVQRLLSGALGKGLRVFEPSAFVLEHLLPHLELTPIDETVMLHITCSSRRMGLMTPELNAAALASLARPGAQGLPSGIQQQPYLRNGAQPARRHSLSQHSLSGGSGGEINTPPGRTSSTGGIFILCTYIMYLRQ
jgi:hypothetical protein